MRTKTTVKPEVKILQVLSEHEEFEQYQMPEATKISYRTILRKLKLLEKLRRIKLVRTEPSEKGGKEKKIYVITLKGLWVYLSELKLNTPENKKKLEQIIKRFPDMLLTFKKWPLFVEAGVKDRILDILIVALRESWGHYYDVMRLFAYTNKMSPKLWREAQEALEKDTWDRLDNLVLVGVFWVPKMKEILLPVYLKDQELSAFVLKKLERAEKEFTHIRELKREFQKGKGE